MPTIITINNKRSFTIDPLRFSWFTLLLLSPMKRISSDMALVSSYAPLALIRSSSALSHPRCPHAWPVHSIEKGYYVFFFFLIEALCSRTGGSTGNNRGHAGMLSTGAFLFFFSLISASDTPSVLVERVDCNSQGFELCFILWL